MMGLKLLLSSMGIEVDPEEITQQIETLRAGVPVFVAEVRSQLQRNDERLAAIEQKLERLIELFDRLHESVGG